MREALYTEMKSRQYAYFDLDEAWTGYIGEFYYFGGRETATGVFKFNIFSHPGMLPVALLDLSPSLQMIRFDYDPSYFGGSAPNEEFKIQLYQSLMYKIGDKVQGNIPFSVKVTPSTKSEWDIF